MMRGGSFLDALMVVGCCGFVVVVEVWFLTAV